jgi:TfoX/Sxy family transcriptional regulator of competence genes
MAKKKMLPFSPERSALLEARIESYGYQAEKQKMFGHETFFTNGYMFTGANVDGIFVHVGEETRDRALSEEKDVAPFRPMGGMVMREHLLLEDAACRDEPRLKGWLDTAYSYLNSRPQKIKRKKKKQG